MWLLSCICVLWISKLVGIISLLLWRPRSGLWSWGMADFPEKIVVRFLDLESTRHAFFSGFEWFLLVNWLIWEDGCYSIPCFGLFYLSLILQRLYLRVCYPFLVNNNNNNNKVSHYICQDHAFNFIPKGAGGKVFSFWNILCQKWEVLFKYLSAQIFKISL